MEYLIIIGILVALVIIVLLFKLIKNIVKTLLTVFLIAVILSVVIGGIVFIDTRNFVNGIKNNENLFLLSENEEFISGFVMINLSKTVSVSNPKLEEFQNYYEENKFDEILEDRHKFFIFRLQSMSEDDKDQQYINFLKGVATEFEVEGDYDNIPDPRTVAFIALVANKVKENPLYLIDTYKEGNLTIYPESITLKMMKMLR